jgi:hypothetical protein
MMLRTLQRTWSSLEGGEVLEEVKVPVVGEPLFLQDKPKITDFIVYGQISS